MDTRTISNPLEPTAPAGKSSTAAILWVDAEKIFGALRKAATRWSTDNASSMGAALAYYTMFSVAPLIMIVVAVAGLVFGQEAARGEIVTQLQGLVGHDGATAIQAVLEGANHPASGIWATIVGVVALIVGATTVFGELQSSFDRIWHTAPSERSSTVLVWLSGRLLSLGMIMALGFLLTVSLLFTAALSGLERWWAPMFGEGALWIAGGCDFALSLLSLTAVFALIYKFLPRVHMRWRDVWIGALATAVLFTLGKFAIGTYIGASGVASPFGAAGSLVAFVVWVYWSAQIFLFGAEFTCAYSGTARPEAPAR